jgi:hypothetical protein
MKEELLKVKSECHGSALEVDRLQAQINEAEA